MVHNPRPLRRNNRLCGEEAIARGKTYYTGYCQYHGETSYRIRVRDNTRWYPECVECAKVKDAKIYMANASDPQDLIRRRNNREILLHSLSNGIKRVTMECLHHGHTEFSISGKQAVCIVCRRIRHLKHYHATKHK